MNGSTKQRKEAWRMTPQSRLGVTAAAVFLGLSFNTSAVASDKLVRSAGDQEQVQFALTLPLNNRAVLDSLLQQLYTPGSPQFHQFLGSADFDARFAPTQAQYQALKSLASQYGLSVVNEHSSHTLLDVQASAATIRNVLGVQMQVKQRADGRQYFAPDRLQTMPFPLASMGAAAAALDQRPLDAQLIRRGAVAQAAVDAAARPNAGTEENGSYSPANIKTAYNLNGIQNGGTPVALFELSSAKYTDAGTYASEFGLNNPTLIQETVAGGTTTTTGSDEVMLDIEMVMAVSNPTTIYVYTGPNSSTGVLDTYTQIADDDHVNQVSTSWGECETSDGQSNVDSENTAFTKMVAEGISAFAAAGDSGADACTELDIFKELGVEDPASQPNVVGVGGTTLTTSSAQAYTSETVWDTSSSEAVLEHHAQRAGRVSGRRPRLRLLRLRQRHLRRLVRGRRHQRRCAAVGGVLEPDRQGPGQERGLCQPHALPDRRERDVLCQRLPRHHHRQQQQLRCGRRL